MYSLVITAVCLTHWQDIKTLVSRMVSVAQMRGHTIQVPTDHLTARPVCVQPLQTNGYDCGVWVLANIAAVLRGYDAADMREESIIFMRRFVAVLASQLSLQ
jgi:Ulp1 family protease